MRPDRRALLAGLAALPLIGAAPAKSAGEPDQLELPLPAMRRISPTLWIAPVAERAWITCFTANLPMIGWYPANGLIVADDQGATVVDTGWDRAQGNALIQLAREVSGTPVASAIVTHFHNDRSGGIEAFRRAGIPVLANPLTTGLARAYGAPEPDPIAGLEKAPQRLGAVELCFPGPGHSPDNITVWHEVSCTLFGGCLVKSTTSTGLGNLEDAVPDQWDAALAALEQRYPRRKTTVPGHGAVQGDAIAYSRRLLAAR